MSTAPSAGAAPVVPNAPASLRPLLQLVYASAATKPFTQAALRELLLKARTKNVSLKVTGLLLYHKLSFFQILEGAEQDVIPLFELIGRDPRHNRVLLLSKKTVERRNFGAWSMGFIDVDQAATALPGYLKLMDAKASFLDLQGDSKLVGRLVDGFQDGKWRQSVEP